MAKTNLRLAGSPAVQSTQRLALAQAIERDAEATRALAANVAAEESVSAKAFEARERVAVATAAIDEAKVAAGAFLTAQALGRAGEPPQSVPAARAAATAAQDELDALLEARTAIEQQRPAAEGELRFASTALDNALAEVVKAEATAEVESLLAQCQELHAALVAKRAPLVYLAERGFVASPVAGRLAEYLRAPRLPIIHGPLAVDAGAEAAWEKSSALEALAGAIAALRADALAPPPFAAASPPRAA